MKVMLVKPAFARLLGNDVYSLYPIGLMLTSAMLKQRGHEVLIFHDDVSNPNPIPIPRKSAHFQEMSIPLPSEEILKPLSDLMDDFQPDVVGVSYCTADRGSAHVVAGLAKQRGIRTVAGGVHPSLLPDDALTLFDAVVVGEGDNPAAAVVFEEDVRGKVVMPPVDNLDNILPDREGVIGWQNYTTFLRGMIYTQRGCPYNCGFCAAPKVFGRRVRMRDVGLVREEVESLGVPTGRIIDDSFGVNRKHGLAVCRELAKVKFEWVCDVALQDVDDERIDAWLDGGCTCINIGIESAVPRWQELSGKHVVQGRPEEVCAQAIGKGLDVVYYFMIGYPGETLDELRQTLAYAQHLKDLGAKPCISIVTPYPCTPLFEIARKWGLVDGEYSYIHQSSALRFADCTTDEWATVVGDANTLNM